MVKRNVGVSQARASRGKVWSSKAGTPLAKSPTSALSIPFISSKMLLDKAAPWVPAELNLPNSHPAGQLTGVLQQGSVFLIHHQLT